MIKINLLPQKKKTTSPALGGLDLSKLNLKYLAIAGVIYFTPGFFQDYFNSQVAGLKVEVENLDKRFKAKKRELKSQEGVQETIKEYIVQEKKLKERLEVVKKIIQLKKNPSGIMLYVAKNMPEDLWLTGLKVEDQKINFKGESVSYKSIGLFIETLKDSVFFDKTIRLTNSQTKKDKKTGRRTEEFEITGTISRFD